MIKEQTNTIQEDTSKHDLKEIEDYLKILEKEIARTSIITWEIEGKLLIPEYPLLTLKMDIDELNSKRLQQILEKIKELFCAITDTNNRLNKIATTL